MKTTSAADHLESLFDLRRIQTPFENRAEVPSRDDMMSIVELSRNDFRKNLKLLVERYRKWDRQNKESLKNRGIPDLKASHNKHEIGTALSAIEELVSPYQRNVFRIRR